MMGRGSSRKALRPRRVCLESGDDQSLSCSVLLLLRLFLRSKSLCGGKIVGWKFKIELCFFLCSKTLKLKNFLNFMFKR